MLFFLKDIKINADITTYLPESDSVVARFNYISKHYSTSQLAVIIVEAEKDIFTKETLEHISTLTKELEKFNGVSFVTSITNVLDIKLPANINEMLADSSLTKTNIDISALPQNFEDLKKMQNNASLQKSLAQFASFQNTLTIPRLIDENNIPQSAEELKKLKDYALSKKLYKDRLISSNSRYSVIICHLSESSERNDVAKKIREHVILKNFPEKFYFEGMPFQVLNILDFIMRDLFFLTPLIILVITLALLFSFRSLRGILVPVLAVGMGTIWSMGIMSLAGVKLSPISDAIPVVLFAVGAAYGIHIVNRFRLMVNSREEKKQQIVKALSEVGISVLLAGITTVMGFMSFIFGSYLSVITEFGIFTAIGVLFILMLSVTFTPALLSYFPAEKKAVSIGKTHKYDFLGEFIIRLSKVILRRPLMIIIIAAAVVIVSVVGIPFLQNKIDILNYFKPNSDIRRSASVMNKEFGGSLPIMVRVRGDIMNPQTLAKMKMVQGFMEQQPDISNAFSVVDFFEVLNSGEDKVNVPETMNIKDIQKQIHRSTPSEDNFKGMKELINRIWPLIQGEEMIKQMINPQKTEAIIQASVRNVDTERYREIYNSLNTFLAPLNTSNLLFEQTGMPGVYSNFDNSMKKNLIQSIILALVLVYICMVFLLRSAKSAIVGMIPLLVTMVLIFGFMGFSGIALDIATILIASITVGAGIDYAIHFITEYKRQISKGLNIDDAITNTLKVTGRPIIINVITIMLGFLVLIFASMMPLINFGILIAITMFFSGMGSITILPSIIKLFNLRLVKKLPGEKT
jgi:hypothetical protein